MSSYVFLYKEKDTDDRDCVKYIKNEPMRFECGHYFGGINLSGACFSTGFKHEDIQYENIITILTEDEFTQLIKFSEDIGNLGYRIDKGDERYSQGVELCEGIQLIFDKLNSVENRDLFADVIEEEKEWLINEYELSEDDVQEIFDNYGMEYQDRGIVSCVFNSIEDCAEEEAYSLGYVTKENDRWFDFEKFGEDLLEEERYMELSDGRVVYFNY